MRLLWLTIAGINSLVSPSNTFTFVGNVSRACLANGTFYQDACGPWPTTGGDTMLPWLEWSQLPFKYDAAFHELDATIYDDFAARFIERGEEIGTANFPGFALMVDASHAWMQVRDTEPFDDLLAEAKQDGRVPADTEFPTLEEPKAAVFAYHACRVARFESANRKQTYDAHHRYQERPSGSIEAIASEFLFKT